MRLVVDIEGRAAGVRQPTEGGRNTGIPGAVSPSGQQGLMEREGSRLGLQGRDKQEQGETKATNGHGALRKRWDCPQE